MPTTRTSPGRAEIAAETRDQLLRAAADEIHAHGFQAASLARILAATGVTKGALYYYFPSKQALGYAVLDEVFRPGLRARWISPLANAGSHGVQTLIDLVEQAAARMTGRDVTLGCPINNLAQEMSPVDAGFRERIDATLDEWRQAIVHMLTTSQAAGQVRAGVDVVSAAAFIVAALEGCIGIAKNAQSKDLLITCGRGLVDYLRGLQADPPSAVGDAP